MAGSLIPDMVRPFARRCRGVLARQYRRLVPVRLDRPLAVGDRLAAVEPLKPASVVEEGGLVECPLRVTNLGGVRWSSRGRWPVTVEARWLGPRRQALEVPSATFKLPAAVGPGEAAVVPVSLPALESLGHYLVELRLSQHGELFGDSAIVDCQVTARPTTDIDYHKVYATADLDHDFWTVVGPGTRAEFDRLSGVKLQHLIDLGLKPDSKLLDVGCGTGLLARAAEGYLSDDGLFFGTDVGPEAVDFCRRQYTRPNFRFAVNEMTRLPVGDDIKFDMICYYSVFTHTFPDETALLLAESERVLADGGAIFADVFTSPMVERYAGNRGAVEVNREHFSRLVALTGLEAELIMSGDWREYGKREFFRFTRAAGPETV